MEELSEEAKNLLIEIKFIASCSADRKISFTLRKYIEPNVWSLDGFKRLLSLETHATVMQHIENILLDTSALLKSITSSNDKNENKIVALFITYLTEMHNVGLTNLHKTYADDPDAAAHLAVIMDQLQLLINNLKNEK